MARRGSAFGVGTLESQGGRLGMVCRRRAVHRRIGSEV